MLANDRCQSVVLHFLQVGTATMLLAMGLAGARGAGGVFPVPYAVVTMGAFASAAVLATLYFAYPRRLRRGRRFRRNALRALGVAGVSVASELGLVLFNTAFRRSSERAQNALAIALPLLKGLLKVGMKKARG